jgi:hypothetical protein
MIWNSAKTNPPMINQMIFINIARTPLADEVAKRWGDENFSEAAHTGIRTSAANLEKWEAATFGMGRTNDFLSEGQKCEDGQLEDLKTKWDSNEG